jgi:hypothetical protein
VEVVEESVLGTTTEDPAASIKQSLESMGRAYRLEHFLDSSFHLVDK